MSYGPSFSFYELIGWIFIATIAAIDMIETALNVFSDGCVAFMVQKKTEHS